jgi:hypothetical protein
MTIFRGIGLAMVAAQIAAASRITPRTRPIAREPEGQFSHIDLYRYHQIAEAARLDRAGRERAELERARQIIDAAEAKRQRRREKASAIAKRNSQ